MPGRHLVNAGGVSRGWNKSIFPRWLSNCLIFINQLEKHMPKYLRRKLHTEFKPKTRIFEIQPTTGVLDPGEKANVQVRFMPKEEVSGKEVRFHSDFASLSFTQSPGFVGSPGKLGATCAFCSD